MPAYPRSVLFRLAGALAGTAFWLGLIVLALTNFDTAAGFPEQIDATWPFWLVAAAVALGVFFVRRRLDDGPGWGAFAIGSTAPFFGLVLNANLDNGLWFWAAVLVIIVMPLPVPRSRKHAGRV